MITFGIIDYPKLRKQYSRWRFNQSTLFAWYCEWSKMWKR